MATFACREHPGHAWQAPWRELLALLPYRQVTLDVLVAVGLLRYACNLQRCEVRRELEHRGIFISDGETSHLSDEFLVRFHLWFDETRSRWVPRLQRGFILLIDGTQDGGGPVTYRAIAYKQGVTVHAATIESENEDELVAFLETVKREVGTPRLIMRDGSKAAENACSRVFAGVPQALCHWHFLKNVGDALLSSVYGDLRKRVLDTRQLPRLEQVRKKLVHEASGAQDDARRVLRVWARLLLEEVLSARDSVGGFPFRLAYHEVISRVFWARDQAKRVVSLAVEWNVHEPLLLEAKERLDALGGDERVRAAFVVVDRRWSWFSRLRSWFRLEDASTGRPNEPVGNVLEEGEVAKRVYALRDEARLAGPGDESAWRVVIDRFQDHRAELFPRVRLKNVPRTTTLVEASHREDRRACRRRRGTLSTRVEMERVGEHLAVWSNVTRPWFARYALAGVDLVAAFQLQDEGTVKAGVARLKAKRFRDRLPVRASARRGLLDEFGALIERQAPVEAFTAWAVRVDGVA